MKKALLVGGALFMAASAQITQAATTTYNVSEVFQQVTYSGTPGRDTYFNGSFMYDDVTKTVSNLQGDLSQAMTGTSPATMNWRHLGYQLSSVYDATLGGLLVSTFFLNNTNVFSNSGGVTGVTGWATGGSKYISTNQNAYVTIFVNTTDPAGTLDTPTSPYVDYKLVYGDCTSGSLMGGMGQCMTGYLTATGGAGGTMQGVNQITQTITAVAPVPEPTTNALILVGLGLVGFLAARRNKQDDSMASFA